LKRTLPASGREGSGGRGRGSAANFLHRDSTCQEHPGAVCTGVPKTWTEPRATDDGLLVEEETGPKPAAPDSAVRAGPRAGTNWCVSLRQHWCLTAGDSFSKNEMPRPRTLAVGAATEAHARRRAARRLAAEGGPKAASQSATGAPSELILQSRAAEDVGPSPMWLQWE